MVTVPLGTGIVCATPGVKATPLIESRVNGSPSGSASPVKGSKATLPFSGTV